MTGTSFMISIALACGATLEGQQSRPAVSPEELRNGAGLLLYEFDANEDPMPLVKKFEGLRVTDVLDALQAVGIQDQTMMDREIRPLWRDNSDKVEHRFYGVAVTYQYVPTNRPPAGKMDYEAFKQWHSHWYRTYAPELFSQILKPGHVVVIDAQGSDRTGFIGSNNALNWRSRGMTGVVTNGNCRDTDELIVQKIPVYSKYQGGGTRPGRIEAAAVNRPVVVGGVLVRPGDFVVADGDGVVVVPRQHLDEVARIAWDIAKGDKEGRRKLYEKMGMKADETVKE
jgi:regulator of RNase E activity RraA